MDAMEPSVVRMGSIMYKLKDGRSSTYGVGGERRKSSFEDDFGIPTEKKGFSFGPHRSSELPSNNTDTDHPPTTASFQPKVRLTEKQKQDIAQAFESFDVQGTGFINADDLRVALRALGFDAPKEEIQHYFTLFDREGTGRLCYSDFISIMEIKLEEPDSKANIMKAFSLFDKDNMGRIAFRNLRDAAHELGEDVNDEEIAEMLAEVDLDDNGSLDANEFYKLMKKPALY